jgi:hypothetical protein
MLLLHNMLLRNSTRLEGAEAVLAAAANRIVVAIANRIVDRAEARKIAVRVETRKLAAEAHRTAVQVEILPDPVRPEIAVPDKLRAIAAARLVAIGRLRPETAVDRRARTAAGRTPEIKAAKLAAERRTRATVAEPARLDVISQPEARRSL